MDAGGACHLCQPNQSLLSLVLRHHHQVCQFIHNHDNARHLFLATAALNLVVIIIQITRAYLLQLAVAAVHFAYHPAQRANDAVELHFHPPQQVRQTIETQQLNLFRVHHHQPQIGGAVVANQAGHYRGDAHALAGAGGARNKQMGHRAEVSCHRRAGDIPTQRNRQWRIDAVKRLRFNHTAETDVCFLPIGYLDAHKRLPGHGRFHADAPRG